MSGISIIIRTKNECKSLDKVLQKVSEQLSNFKREVIVVDSGSTDNTLDIARDHKCKIIEIPSEQFSWGAAINIGFSAATYEYCILLSGHCFPFNQKWLDLLIKPLEQHDVVAAVHTSGVLPHDEVGLTVSGDVFAHIQPLSPCALLLRFFVVGPVDDVVRMFEVAVCGVDHLLTTEDLVGETQRHPTFWY